MDLPHLRSDLCRILGEIHASLKNRFAKLGNCLDLKVFSCGEDCDKITNKRLALPKFRQNALIQCMGQKCPGVTEKMISAPPDGSREGIG